MENQKLEVIFEILYALDEAKIETNLYDKITKLEAVHQRAYSISQHYPKGDVYSKILKRELYAESTLTRLMPYLTEIKD